MSIIKNGKNIIGVYKGDTPILKIFKHNNLVYQLSSTGGTETQYDITSTFNVTSTTSPTKVCDRTSAFTEMYVDNMQISPTSAYTFSSTGEHTVGYTLSDKTTIGNSLFDRCIGLTSVKIIDSVTNIDSGAFYNCSGLTSIKMPSSVISIGESAFGGCRNLTSLDLGSSLTNIDAAAFQNCNSLESLTIPSSVTSIYDSVVFINCYFESDKFINNSSVSGYPWGANICDVIQEDGLCISGTTAVNCRKNATNVTIPDSITTIENSTFIFCTSLSSVTIGSGVNTIDGSTFKDCTSLQKVTIGSGVTSVGTNSFFMAYSIFDGCTSLNSITCLAPTAPTLLTKSIQGIENNNGVLYVPQGSDYSTWKSILTTWTIQFI